MISKFVFQGDHYAMFMIPSLSESDFGFFIRPFRQEIWYCLLSLLIISMILIFGSTYFMKSKEDTISIKLYIFSLWIFFTLIYAYYGGALTMFFVNDDEIPFKSIRDALKEFPKWKIIFNSDIGTGPLLKAPAERVKTNSA